MYLYRYSVPMDGVIDGIVLLLGMRVTEVGLTCSIGLVATAWPFASSTSHIAITFQRRTCTTSCRKIGWTCVGSWLDQANASMIEACCLFLQDETKDQLAQAEETVHTKTAGSQTVPFQAQESQSLLLQVLGRAVFPTLSPLLPLHKLCRTLLLHL